MGPWCSRGALVASILASSCLSAQQPGRTLRPQQAAVIPVQEARIALVIGNGAYRDAPLRNPVNDARAMAEVLRAEGFQVIALEDASLQAMRQGLRDFGGRIGKGGVGLFYYAGHGMQVKGRNYLIPVGADIQAEDEVAGAALDVDTVLAKLESARNRLNILILDACRNDPFARSFRGGSQGLAPLDAPTGTFIAFATAPGRAAADGNGPHGLYTEQLLQAIQTPGLKLEDTFKRVLSGVRRASRDQQIPWTSSSVEGDFYFVPGGVVLPAPAPSPTVAPAWLEGVEARKFLVKDGFESPAEYQARLAKLPLLRVGTAKLLRERYDSGKQRLPLKLQVDEWAIPWVPQKQSRLELDRAKAKALCEQGDAVPLMARFEARGEKAVLEGLTLESASGSFVLPPPSEVVVKLGEGASSAVMALVQIPAGTFRMGSNNGGDTRPAHEVTISQDFWMGKYPVTQAQWKAVMGDNPSTFKQAGPDAPVERVGWKDGQAFLAKLNQMQGPYSFRLPTEAEWEYACRAGTEGDRYGELDTIAWFAGNSGGSTHPVGQKQPNAFGLHDMFGNVWQWCQDAYDPGYYQRSPLRDPVCTTHGKDRVLRGGSFYNDASWFTASTRGLDYPGPRRYYNGIRVVAVPRRP